VSRPAGQWDEAWAEEFRMGKTDSGGGSPVAVARVLPAPPEPARAPSGVPAAQPRRRIRWGQVAAVAIVGYLLFVGASSELTLLGVTRQANSLGTQASRLAAANQGLRHELTLLHQPRYVDELARTELGYVSPGEEELVPTEAASHGAGAGRS
jgi:cell division protein FtsB